MFKDHLYKKNNGFILVEAMIGLLLLAFVGLALAYAFNKLIAAQKNNNIVSTLGLQMRAQMSNGNLSSGYTSCTNSQTNLTVTGNITATQNTTCTLKTVQLTFGDGSVTTLSVPITEYSISGNAIGSIPYKFTN